MNSKTFIYRVLYHMVACRLTSEAIIDDTRLFHHFQILVVDDKARVVTFPPPPYVIRQKNDRTLGRQTTSRCL